MRTRSLGVPIAAVCVATLLLLAGCGGGDASSSSARKRTPSTTATTAPANGTTGSGIVNVWSGRSVDRTRLPIGTSHVSQAGPAVGGLYVCSAGNPNGGGARVAGPWIDEAAGTWDATKKVAVQGSVAWPMAQYDEQVGADTRTIAGNGLPVGQVTGTFPIAATDPAYAYDRNQNSIRPYPLTLSLPVTPTVASTPGCLSGGPIGIARNGVALYAPLDEGNRDAVAYETQDTCDGHPQQASMYHYHAAPSCIVAASTGSSTVIGFARDGYPIVVERDADGELPTDADLDECHGRTSPVLLDGAVVTTYHYAATHEFPYFMGCFHGVTS